MKIRKPPFNNNKIKNQCIFVYIPAMKTEIMNMLTKSLNGPKISFSMSKVKIKIYNLMQSRDATRILCTNYGTTELK